MFKKIFATMAIIFSAGAASAITVDSTAAVYGAGVGRLAASTAPVSVSLGGDTTFNITATGFTDCCAGSIDMNPDGSTGTIDNGNTNINGLNGISGIFVQGRQMFLAGVFVDSNNFPTMGSGPTKLSLLVGDLSFASFAPILNQTFYIGDGLTGIGIGAMQEFVAPTGADTLLLGFVDGGYFRGDPNAYQDNRGSLEVTVNAVRDTQLPAVPLPAGMPLLLAGLAAFGWVRRRA